MTGLSVLRSGVCKTLNPSQISSAIQNRKDIDQKHVQAQRELERQIREISHTLDNGLGRRIDEKLDGKINPVMKDIEWLKSN